jgi:hypothetical protein
MFSFFKNKNQSADKLYSKIVKFSRNKYFYEKVKLPDIYKVRILLIFFHFSFLLIELKKKDETREYKKFSQNLFDFLFNKIDEDMRENGLGDVSVSKNMKILINQFYNILLNCEGFSNFNDKKKIDLFNKNLQDEKIALNADIPELVNYFKKYQTFCFDLSLNSVIKGDFNFKY